MAFSTPFEGGAPLAGSFSGAFFGWAAQVHLETGALLSGRDADWLNAVAKQIQTVLDADPRQFDCESSRLSHGNPSRSEGTPFPYMVNKSSQLGLFAEREPACDWSQHAVTTEQWERYAVFAALSTREALVYLNDIDSYAIQGLAYNEAGGFAIEAMRALQIAQSLRTAKLAKSRHGQVAARARHEAMEPMRAKAVEMANSHPFTTKRAAIDHIVENLELDPVKRTFPSRRAVEEWLKAAGWVPTHKRH